MNTETVLAIAGVLVFAAFLYLISDEDDNTSGRSKVYA